MVAALVENGLETSGTTAQRPANAVAGQRYFDTTLGHELIYTGTAWQPSSGVVASQILFTETAGAGTYTGAVTVPAGATILDIIVDAIALWAASSAATLIVGATDDDGYYTGVNLKATDLLAGESLSFALAGGKVGAYIANSQVSPRYSATARTINGIVTTTGATGATGLTRMTVVYALPSVANAVKS